MRVVLTEGAFAAGDFDEQFYLGGKQRASSATSFFKQCKLDETPHSNVERGEEKQNEPPSNFLISNRLAA